MAQTDKKISNYKERHQAPLMAQGLRFQRLLIGSTVHRLRLANFAG